MPNEWVNFKAVKESVSIQMVLDHYQVNWLRKEKQELAGRCPIHRGEGERAFHVSLAKNVFNCFSCKARGNVLDFVAAMDKCSVRDAAVKLAEWFSISNQEQDGKQNTPVENKSEPVAPPSTVVVGERPVVNKPLNFQLKNIDYTHPYLAGRSITRETAEQFGVGYFSGKGSMSGRIVFPIHNERGELVAYAGRAIDEAAGERYKFPAGFHKSAVLYNLHRVLEKDSGTDLVVVEGFFDCMKVWQAGFPSVALMGSSVSELQTEILVRKFPAAVLMLDGDDAGRAGAEDFIRRLVSQAFVKAIVLPVGKQPDMLTDDELGALLKK